MINMALVCNYNGRANIHSPCMHRIASHGPFPARSPPSSRRLRLVLPDMGTEWGVVLEGGLGGSGARGLGEESPK